MNRLGIKGIHELKAHPWFANYDFDSLKSKSTKSPFIPKSEENVDYEYVKNGDKLGQNTKERYREIVADENFTSIFADFFYINTIEAETIKRKLITRKEVVVKEETDKRISLFLNSGKNSNQVLQSTAKFGAAASSLTSFKTPVLNKSSSAINIMKNTNTDLVSGLFFSSIAKPKQLNQSILDDAKHGKGSRVLMNSTSLSSFNQAIKKSDFDKQAVVKSVNFGSNECSSQLSCNNSIVYPQKQSGSKVTIDSELKRSGKESLDLGNKVRLINKATKMTSINYEDIEYSNSNHILKNKINGNSKNTSKLGNPGLFKTNVTSKQNQSVGHSSTGNSNNSSSVASQKKNSPLIKSNVINNYNININLSSNQNKGLIESSVQASQPKGLSKSKSIIMNESSINDFKLKYSRPQFVQAKCPQASSYEPLGSLNVSINKENKTINTKKVKLEDMTYDKLAVIKNSVFLGRSSSVGMTVKRVLSNAKPIYK